MVENTTKKSKPRQLSRWCEWEEIRIIVAFQNSTAAVTRMNWGGDCRGWSEGAHAVENPNPDVLRYCCRNARGRKKPYPRTAQLLLYWQAERRGEKSTIWQSPTGAVSNQFSIAVHIQTREQKYYLCVVCPLREGRIANPRSWSNWT